MQQSARGSAWLSRITAAVLIMLLAAFYITTVNNMIAVDHKTEQIKNSPYPVSVAAGGIETLLTQCRTLADRPLYVRTDGAIANVEQSYAQIDEEMREKTAFIADNHDIDAKTATALKRGYEDLADIQTAYIALCRNPDVTDEQIAAFANDSIKPVIDKLLELDRTVLDESSESVDDLYATVTAVGAQTIAVASALMAAVILSLAVYLTILRRNRKQKAQLQEDVRHALALAQTANAAKSQFLSNMSHDIRTPMNAIIGMTALAASHTDQPERVRDCLEKISISSSHLLSLINEILDMSRIEKGKLELLEEPFHLETMLDNIYSIIKPTAMEKNHDITFIRKGVIHESLIGDANRVKQVLLNLITNAVKYTPDNGIIRVTTEEVPMGKAGWACYRFVVEDNGIGMSEEYMKQVFEPFSRAGVPVVQEQQGTGLGMSIAQGIVSTMQGDIHVESREGEGSCFTVTLNFRIQGKEQERAGGMRDCIRDDDMDCSSLAGRRILLVEDNALNMEIARAILCEHGLEVDGAENGQEAYERFTSSAPGTYEAVLMDLQMPVMDGCTAARMIRASSHPQARTIPIIALTANAFAEDVAKALTSGMNYHIAKPIDFHQLFHALKQFMTTS